MEDKANHPSKSDKYCTYCHKRNHNKEDCFKLTKKKDSDKKTSSQPSPSVAAVSKIEASMDNAVAVDVPSDDKKIHTNNSVVSVSTIDGKNYPCLALLDTGSLISFLCSQSFFEIFVSSSLLVSTNKSFKAINSKPIQIIGTIKTTIKLDSLSDFQPIVSFHILDGNAFSNKMVLGQDF